MGMTEILSALMLLGGIIDNTGKNPTIIAFWKSLNRLSDLVLTVSMTVKANSSNANHVISQKHWML